MAGAVLCDFQVVFAWQGHDFRMVQVVFAWQGHDFRIVRLDFPGRCSTL